MIDESLLTGESLAVTKSDWDKKTDPEHYKIGKEKNPLVFSGTLVTQGHGLAKVLKIGIHTEMGRIGKSLQTIREEDTLLKKEINEIVRNFAIWSAFLCTLAVILYYLTRGNLLEGILSGVSLSMSLIPEEFPIVFIVFMTLGAWRISKRSVLTRNTAAIETLGAAKVLCVDKTGTITFNRMQLETLVVDDNEISLEKKTALNETFHKLLEYSILASQKDPFDPIEKEIRTAGTEILKKDEHQHIHKSWSLIKEYPLSKHLFALSHVWESPNKDDYVIAAKGAPESIFDLCHLDNAKQQKLLRKVKSLSDKGMRLIAVAKAKADNKTLPKSQHDFDFKYIGLLGFSDPVRPGINKAIGECYQAGIRVIMITGDYPGTAQYIGKKIGLLNADKFLTGDDIAKMDESRLRKEIKDVNIFARVVPEQKLLIVKALKANGEIVAMTGDGVNDAPALKAAHIGIAMGERGTDVARETADLVLLKDDFASIVEAVKLGRRIFDNLKKAISYVFAIHVPIAGMTLLPIALNFPIVLFPAHIAFLELIIDPSSSIVFEAEPAERNTMSRPPRNLRSPIFDKRAFIVSILQGTSALSIVFIVYMFSLHLGKGEEEVRSLTFITIVFSNLMLVVTNLSWSKTFIKVFMEKNKALYGVFSLAVLFLGLIIYLPFFQNLFHFTTLHLDDIAIALTAGIISVLWFEGFKTVIQKRTLSKLPLHA
jgi:Ca2+-transporting ATPase